MQRRVPGGTSPRRCPPYVMTRKTHPARRRPQGIPGLFLFMEGCPAAAAALSRNGTERTINSAPARYVIFNKYNSKNAHYNERKRYDPRRRGSELPQRTQTRQNRHRADQAPHHAARPGAGLLARRGGPEPRHRRRARRHLPLYGPRQPGGRHLQRNGRSGAGQHRSGGRKARHGGQGDALQDLRGARRLRHRGRHDRPRRLRPHGTEHRHHLRRHQPRGHQGSGVLRNRGPAAPANSTSPSCTTTSTARPSSPPPR